MRKTIYLLLLLMMLTAILGSCSTTQSVSGNDSLNRSAQANEQFDASNPLQDADVIIEKSGITETAQFIPVTMDGVSMEIIAVKAPDGTLRTAFNTCQVCYDSGRGYYEQDGDVLVCQNCGNRFQMNQVSIAKGGCNPVGIHEELRTETDTVIIIGQTVLKQAIPLFGNWKTL